MKIKTAQDLFEFLKQVVADGHGDARIYFDSEARQFECHYVKVGSAYLENTDGEIDDGGPIVTIHYERY